MSWAYHVTGDAEVSLRRTDIEVQEAIYDLLEELIDRSELLMPGDESEHVVTALIGDEVVAAVIRIRVSPHREVLTVMSIETA